MAGKEKRALKLGNVSKLYAQDAQGTSVVIGRKRDRHAMVETSARRGRQVVAQKAPRGRPPTRLSSPLPPVSSSESEEEERAEEPLEDVVPSEDDYQGRGEESEEEEEQQREESEEEEEEDAVADEDLLTTHPLDLLGVVREGKVYLRGPSGFPERKLHGVLDVTSDA